MSDITYLTCKVMNVKAGETSNGNPYRRFGLKVQDGEKKGEWVNFFRVVTEKTLKFYKQDCAAMGVTSDDPDNFQADGRLCTVKWGPGTNPKRPGEYDVLGILPYDDKKAKKAPKNLTEDSDDTLPF